MQDKSGLTCSFCGKPASEVKLIAGPAVYICDECVEACQGMLDSMAADDPPMPKSKNFDALAEWRAAEAGVREAVIFGLIERADKVRKRARWARAAKLHVLEKDGMDYSKAFEAAALILAEAGESDPNGEDLA